MTKRLLTLLIALITVFSVLAANSVYAEDDGEQPVDNPFADVPEGSWFTDGVLFCYEKGYMFGTSQDMFSPNVPLTRAMFVTVLSRIANADTDPYHTSHFNDVKVGEWYSKPIEWAYSDGYASGTGGGNFSPNGPLTRETLAQFLYTYSKKNGRAVAVETDIGCYNDVLLVSSWAKDAVTWAVDFGLLSGTGNSTLSPTATCTRAQTALIVMKYIKYYSFECQHKWTCPTCTEGRVCVKCGYTRGTPLGHDADVSCTEGGVCKRCNETVAPLGHIYRRQPTCTEGVDCLRCGEHAEPLGHNFKDEKCTRCGISQFSNIDEKVVYYLKKNGTKADSNYTMEFADKQSTHETHLALVYDEAEEQFKFEITRLYGDDVMYMVLSSPRIGGIYRCECTYYVAKSDALYTVGRGFIDSAEVDGEYVFVFDAYTLSDSNRNGWQTSFTSLLRGGLDLFNEKAAGNAALGKLKLSDLGFVNY